MEGWGRVRATFHHGVPSLRARVVRHLFEIAVAVAWTLIGATYLVDGSAITRSVVGESVAPFDTIWAVFYVVGGPLALYGVLFLAVRVRVGGLILLGTGLIMQGLAAAYVQPADPRWMNFFIFAGACLSRAHLLTRITPRR